MRAPVFALLSLLALAAAEPPPALRPSVEPPPEARRSATGVASMVLRPGQETRRPSAEGMVALGFTGWTQEGKTFAEVPADDLAPRLFVARLMPGMREAVLEMTPGERRRIWVPEALAFGGAEGRPRGPVVMELELLDALPDPRQAPEDVAGPGADAVMLKSGLAYRILRPGRGTEHPKRTSHVCVHYSGWTVDGKLFDSSLLKRSHELLKLTEVIEGWREGLMLMTPGERRRLWVPQRLAYQGAAGMPKGMLVFDVELLSIPR